MERSLRISERLHNADIPFFSTMVTRSQMEIPAQFVREQGERMYSQSTLRLASPGSKVWPVKIQMTYSVRWRVRFCTRWRKFISKHGLQQGDELLISLVESDTEFVSEFVVYMFKNKLQNRQIPLRYTSLSTDTSTHSSEDDLLEEEANTPKSRRSTELRARRPLNISTPAGEEEMHWEDFSPDKDVFPAGRSVAREPERYRDNGKKQKVAVSSPRREHVKGKRPEISENIFNGESYFEKRLTESCVGYLGKPHQARFEMRSDFFRHHGKFFSEGTVFTLEGPSLGNSCEVVCHQFGVSDHRVMWKEGWPTFVKRNKLKKGDELKFTLVAPDRFSVELTSREHRSTETVSDFHIMSFEEAFIPDEKRGSPARGHKASNELSLDSDDRGEVANLHKDQHFIKTLTHSSDSKHNPYPHLVIPASFWQKVQLPLEVNMQGPKSDVVFPVKCFGVDRVGNTKTFKSGGWKKFQFSNKLKAGDTLQFTYTKELKLFKVDYA